MCVQVHRAAVSICIRIRELSGQQRRLEEEAESARKELSATQQTNQALIDEHQALQLAYNSHEKKLRDIQMENDRLVSSDWLHTCVVAHSYRICF